jgi:peptidoglycan hydrolase CwlO-like protein
MNNMERELGGLYKAESDLHDKVDALDSDNEELVKECDAEKARDDKYKKKWHDTETEPHH